MSKLEPNARETELAKELLEAVNLLASCARGFRTPADHDRALVRTAALVLAQYREELQRGV